MSVPPRLTPLALALVLALTGCTPRIEVVTPTPLPPPAPTQTETPGLDAREGPWTFGREMVLPRDTFLTTGRDLLDLPAGSKVRVAGDVDDVGNTPVLVLDGPLAGRSGTVHHGHALNRPELADPPPSR